MSEFFYQEIVIHCLNDKNIILGYINTILHVIMLIIQETYLKALIEAKLH